MQHPGILILSTLLLQTPSLDSTSPRERIDAVEQLSLPGRTENIAAIDAALRKEPRSDVRAAMVAGLARIGGAGPVPILTASLRSDLDKDVRLQVVESLQRLYIPVETPGPIRTVFNRVRGAFTESGHSVVHDPAAVDPTVNAALAESMEKDSSQEVRAQAARALGSLRARDRVSTMISTLELPQNREHPEVRLEIVESLGLVRDPAAGPALERAVRDSDRRIARAAVVAIGMVGYKNARSTIENIFRTDRNKDMQKSALEALALMRDPGSLPLFESLLGNSDDYYRELAAEGLARIDHDPSILRTRYEQEKKANVRNAIAFAMVAADKNEYFDILATGLDSRQDYQVEVYLYELGKFEGKLPELHRYLKSMNARVRAGMARIVGNIGDPSSRPLIEELTKDRNAEVVREAIAALRKLSAG